MNSDNASDDTLIGANASNIVQLRARADSLPNGPAKLRLLEEAARLADAAGDVEQGFDIRDSIVEVATFAGEPETSLVAFAWQLAEYDKNPDDFILQEYTLLWQYKWMLGAAVKFPTISRAQIEEMLADFRTRLKARNSNDHPYQQRLRSLARQTGDYTLALKAQRAVNRLPVSVFSDCKACEFNAQAELHFERQEYEQGLTILEPVLDRRVSCAEVPNLTYADVLRPLLALGRSEEAVANHLKGLKFIRDRFGALPATADHLIFQLLTGHRDRAKRLVERHLPEALGSRCPAIRFDFLRAVVFFLEQVQRAKSRMTVRVSTQCELPADVDPRDMTALHALFRGEIEQTAQAFDARNGTARYAIKLKEIDAWHDQVSPLEF